MLGALLSACAAAALWAAPAAPDSTRMVFFGTPADGVSPAAAVPVIGIGGNAVSLGGTGINPNGSASAAPNSTPGATTQILRTPGTGTTPSGPVPKPEVPNVGSAGPVGTGNAFQPYATAAPASSSGQTGK